MSKNEAACKRGSDDVVLGLFTACAAAGLNPGELIKQLNTPKSHGNKAS